VSARLKSGAATRRSARQELRPRTAEDNANEQIIEQLALRIWAALVGEKVLKDMSALLDELLQSYLLDDDDEESDEGWLDDQQKREKKLLIEALADGLNKYPDIASVNNLPVNSDPDIARGAEELKTVLTKCAIGATRFEEKFSRAQLERMVKRDLEIRFKKDPKYSVHVREDVPGSDAKQYGSRGRTSSKGTFVRTSDYLGGGGLDALLTGGWLRVAKDRIDPVAWSHQHGLSRKTEKQSWRHHFVITERNGRQSSFALPRESLAGKGALAVKLLMKAGVHVVGREGVQRALVQFLGFKPKHEIVRVPRVGWAQIGEGWMIFVRPDEVITPPGMPQAGHTSYKLDAAATRHGLHIAGTTAEWAAEVATPLQGNSNVALSFATFFAAPLLCFASEPGGGYHIYGQSTIGKTMDSAAGQSIYGWPHETADDAFGVSWDGTEAGFDALALARTDLGLPLDEITLAKLRTAEQVIYKVASGTKGPRATSAGHLRESAHASVLVFSTGEKSLAQFIGPSLQEGARKRLVDVPAEVQPGSAFETIPHDQIHVKGKRFFDAVKRQHGAVGLAWQHHLVELGPDMIKANLDRHREAFLALPEVTAVTDRAHPQVRAVINRFALCAAALRMAIEADLLPWSTAQADTGIVACMSRWVAQRGNVDVAGEIVRAARQIELELVAGLDRFIAIYKVGKAWKPATEADALKQETSKDFDGYVKPDRILVRPEAWRRYCNGVDPSEIARHFQRRGVLIADGEGVSKAEQVIGKADRFYVLLRASLTSLHSYSESKVAENSDQKSTVRR
jgi:uncharacterized protein (DUF927 family)